MPCFSRVVNNTKFTDSQRLADSLRDAGFIVTTATDLKVTGTIKTPNRRDRAVTFSRSRTNQTFTTDASASDYAGVGKAYAQRAARAWAKKYNLAVSKFDRETGKMTVKARS